jgi:catechol 2,3-dioxygenase-like lactoylglutathione lyase family enzyme
MAGSSQIKSDHDERGAFAMIDHISICVRDLDGAARFYEAVLGTIGYRKLRIQPNTVGFGKTYPEFWINLRPAMTPPDGDSGSHVAVRAPAAPAIDAFHAAALAAGGESDGAPGRRPQYSPDYYAAFIRDPDGNRIEAVTFLKAQA